MDKWKKTGLFLGAVALPLTVGGLSALLTGGFDATYVQPPLSPPGWVFPTVWTVLYILMGAASFLVLRSRASAVRRRRALNLYLLQLGLNFLWPFVFFRLRLYFAASLWMAVLWLLVFMCALHFVYIRKKAGLLMLPYLIWCTFALCLSFAVYLLN